MNFSSEKLTVKSQEAIAATQRLAVAKSNPEVLGLHLLATLLEEVDGNMAPIFKATGADLRRLKEAVSAELNRLPRVSGGSPSVSAELQKIFII